MEPVCNTCSSWFCTGHHEDGQVPRPKRGRDEELTHLYDQSVISQPMVESPPVRRIRYPILQDAPTGVLSEDDRPNDFGKRPTNTDLASLQTEDAFKRLRRDSLSDTLSSDEIEDEEELSETGSLDIMNDEPFDDPDPLTVVAMDEVAEMLEKTQLVYTTIVFDRERGEEEGLNVYQKSISLGFDPHESLLMNDEDFIAAAETCSDFAHLTVHQGKFISDKGVIEVIQRKYKYGQSRLYCLSLGRLPNLTDKTLEAIGEYCPKLRELHLNAALDQDNSPKFTNYGLVQLVQRCRDLEVLNLNWCRFLASVSLSAIGTHCKGLREFSAIRCLEFTLDGFKALIDGCIALERIELSHCMQVTDEWLYYIINSKLNLKELDVSGCTHLSQQVLTAISRRFPDMKLTADKVTSPRNLHQD